MTHAQGQARSQFVSNLPLVMNEAGKVGLWKTMHKLHEAVRAAGYELAEQMTKEQKLAREEERKKIAAVREKLAKIKAAIRAKRKK